MIYELYLVLTWGIILVPGNLDDELFAEYLFLNIIKLHEIKVVYKIHTDVN